MPHKVYEYPAGIRRAFDEQPDGTYAERVSVGGSVAVTGQSSGVLASNGKTIYPDNEAVTLTYTNGFVTSLTLTTGGVTYVQTIGRDGSGNVTSLSKWVAQ